MVKVKDLRIEFDNVDGVYFAGQEVRGHVFLALQEAKKINEVLLEFKGAAKTYWTKHSGKSRKHCSDSEPYFCVQFNTEYTHSFGKAQERVLPAGVHRVPFTHKLPRNLPSSFEGEFGFIRFTVKATLERPWDFDIVTKRAFSVVGIEDLNEDMKAREPVKLEDSSFDIKFCCRKRGSVSVTLSLPKSGFAPGESVPISAEVVNDSTKTLRYACARIKQEITYRAKSFQGHEQSKEVTKVIVSKEKGQIAPMSRQRWDRDRLPIPPVPPKLLRCRVVDISYTLEFEVDPGIVVMSPIIVGTIPLLLDERPTSTERETSSDSVVVTVTDEEGLVVSAASAAADPQTGLKLRDPGAFLAHLYPELAPPVFQDSLFGAVDISDEQDTFRFAPKYPCYKEVL